MEKQYSTARRDERSPRKKSKRRGFIIGLLSAIILFFIIVHIVGAFVYKNKSTTYSDRYFGESVSSIQ